jgi:ubiquinone/menaquinone biosynthesis C-methylase UbiE
VPVRDRWAAWLLERRHGGDAERLRETLDFLAPVRDRVLDGAAPSEDETLLDVGAGDGLVAFGALERVGDGGRVIFSDVSQDLLDHSQALAEEMGVADRCRFLLAPADDLSALGDESVDAVTTRSVLIYVEDKRRAFEEFYRVLKPGGRLSIFEPINRFRKPEPPHLFLGYDVTPVQDLARKVWAVYAGLQPMDEDPMVDFDERDLLDFAEGAGFARVHLDYEAEVVRGGHSGWDVPGWESFLKTAGNPKIPTLEEAMEGALTPEEAERFTAHLRPLVENARRVGATAVAYLRAVKGEG